MLEIILYLSNCMNMLCLAASSDISYRNPYLLRLLTLESLELKEQDSTLGLKSKPLNINIFRVYEVLPNITSILLCSTVELSKKLIQSFVFIIIFFVTHSIDVKLETPLHLEGVYLEWFKFHIWAPPWSPFLQLRVALDLY